MTPIIGAAVNTPEWRYTQAHCRARNSVERCIGVLKTMWRCLHKDRVLNYHPRFVAKIIYCCGILHNIMRMRNLEMDIDYDFENEVPAENFDNPRDNRRLFENGRQIRNNLIHNHFN